MFFLNCVLVLVVITNQLSANPSVISPVNHLRLRRNPPVSPAPPPSPTGSIALEQALGQLEADAAQIPDDTQSQRSGYSNTADRTVSNTQAKKTISQKFKKLKDGSGKYQIAKSFGKEKGTKVAGAVSTVGAGIAALTAGYRNGDWKGMASGALRIASGICAMLGPAGALVSTVLNIAATLFGALGLISSTPPESEEDMIKRVVETALEESVVNALKAEISGVSHLYTSLADSVAHLRKIKEDKTSELKITVAMGSKLYNHAFTELVAFGKLQEVINKYCDAGFLETDELKKENKRKNADVRKSAKRCATFVRLYCDLSVKRIFLLVDMAAVVSDIPGLEATSKNFGYLIKREQEKDHEFLRFLSDPINFPKRRFAVYHIFDRTEGNSFLMTYIKSLHGVFPYYPGFYQPPVIGCTNSLLQGKCKALNNNHVIKGSVMSVFVPFGKVVKDISIGGSPAKTVRLMGTGTYHGYARSAKVVLSVGIPKNSKGVVQDALDEVRVCFKEITIPNHFAYRSCKSYNPNKEEHTLSVPKQGVVEIDTVQIPSKHDITLIENNKPIKLYQGPDNLANLCQADKWTGNSKIKVTAVNTTPRQVRLCDDENLQGKCSNIHMRKSGESVFIDIQHLTTCQFQRIKSMLIPKGVEVTLHKEKTWKDEEGMIGPFMGAVTLGKIADLSDLELEDYRYVKVMDHMDRSFEACFVLSKHAQTNGKQLNQNSPEVDEDSVDCKRFKVGEDISDHLGIGGDFSSNIRSTMRSFRVPSNCRVTYFENYRRRKTRDGPLAISDIRNDRQFSTEELPLSSISTD